METTSSEKLHTAISQLQKEMDNLRSFIIGFIGKDKEGTYNPNFVKKILKASREPTAILFKDKKNFLSQLEKNV